MRKVWLMLVLVLFANSGLFAYDKSKKPRFERDDKKKVVIDHKLGLMWQDNRMGQMTFIPDSAYKLKKYDDDSRTPIKSCERFKHAGYTDWRLPKLYELQTTVVPGKKRLAIRDVFKSYPANYLQGIGFWSSSIPKGKPEYVWVVEIDLGRSYMALKGRPNYVRCVRDIKDSE